MNIDVVKIKIIVQGLTGKIKTIYNTPDVNFKFISFPIKYSIIIHPTIKIKEKENLVEISKPSVTVEALDSNIYLLFSKFEIVLFFISLILLTVFIIIYILFLK
jgi:hypothetical protein